MELVQSFASRVEMNADLKKKSVEMNDFFFQKKEKLRKLRKNSAKRGRWVEPIVVDNNLKNLNI